MKHPAEKMIDAIIAMHLAQKDLAPIDSFEGDSRRESRAESSPLVSRFEGVDGRE